MAFQMENYYRAGNEETVPKKEREANREKIDGLLSSLSKEVNDDLGEDLLDEKGCVNMDHWKVKEGGIYSKEEIKADAKNVKEKQLLWSGAETGSVINHYREKHGWQNMEPGAVSEKILEQWKADREKSNPALAESLVTVLFHKLLKDRFAVMRSSVHDDYENGVDNIMVDKQTGQVICAFDEVHGETKFGGDERKEEKIIKKAKRGGTQIKYGLTFADGKPVKKKIDNVPMFYLSLTPDDLNKVMSGMSGNLNDPATEVELSLFDRLVDSLNNQVVMLAEEKLPENVAANIEGFKEILQEMKNIRQAKA